MFGSPGWRYKSTLSAAIHYATLNSFRSIKLPISLYKPPVLMEAPTKSPEQGNYDRVGDTKWSAELIQSLLDELQGLGKWLSKTYVVFFFCCCFFLLLQGQISPDMFCLEFCQVHGLSSRICFFFLIFCSRFFIVK